MKSGVPSNLYRPYNFEDQAWATPGNPNYNEIAIWLAERCVNTGATTYMIWDQTLSAWTPVVGRTNAINKIMSEYPTNIQLKGGSFAMLSRDTVSNFIAYNCPIVPGEAAIPLGGKMVIYDNRKCLNIWSDTIMRGDPAKAGLCEEFLLLIKHSLCNASGPELPLSDMLAELQNPNGNKEFRFMMSWLAAIYQNPGINLQTNLWIKGKNKGIGKGTLMRILSIIFGTSFGKTSAEEMERGWNDGQKNKLIIEADEYKSSGKANIEALIKRDTTNPTITIMQRGKTPQVVPNVTNWIFTTNEEQPIFVEDYDRRNVFIGTTEDVSWRQRAYDFNQKINSYVDDLAEGFAAILSSMPVDLKFVNIAYETKAGTEMRELSKNAAKDWAENDDTLEPETWIQSKEAYTKYFVPYRDRYWEKSNIRSIQSFGRLMGEFVVEWTDFTNDPPSDDAIYRVSRPGYGTKYWFPKTDSRTKTGHVKPKIHRLKTVND